MGDMDELSAYRAVLAIVRTQEHNSAIVLTRALAAATAGVRGTDYETQFLGAVIDGIREHWDYIAEHQKTHCKKRGVS